jgi:NADPH:quinone reductase-like Zn-dependent oxidoreductase
VIVFAVQFDRFGPPEVLVVGPFPEPHAGPGEVRVAVRADGSRQWTSRFEPVDRCPAELAAITGAAALFEEGRFRVPLREVFPLAQAARAHTLAARGPRRGKIVLTVPLDPDDQG